MAWLEDRLSENVTGDFYVGRSCIDGDTCRRIAPAVFARSPAREQAYVHHQPENDDEPWAAEKALVACPTSSIGAAAKMRTAAAASFGALTFLIRRPGGNVLVDSPRASRRLLARLRALGGARTIFLTHRDDAAATGPPRGRSPRDPRPRPHARQHGAPLPRHLPLQR